MFFVLSKTVGMLLYPVNLGAALLCLGALLSWTRWRRVGRVLVTGVALAAAAALLTPLDAWLAQPLETRFARPDPMPERVAGIIVLGGGEWPVLSAARGTVETNEGGERFTAAMTLARRYPDARVLFSGGSGDLAHPEFGGAPVAARLLLGLGLDRQRLVLEADSRNTYQNAVNSKRLVAPKAGETWLLVTSALHMPRSVGVFRKQGWEVVPYPVDYRTAGAQWGCGACNIVTPLHTIQSAGREWAGLLVYRLAGRTSALFPRPDSAAR